MLDTTYLAVLFFDFATCPCSFRTKRHDNLFVYDDDDDDDDIIIQLSVEMKIASCHFTMAPVTWI